jgi:HSP20 family protein
MTYPTVYSKKVPNVFSDVLDAFVRDAWNSPMSSASTKYDVYADKQNYYLDVELPGVSKDNVHMNVEADELKISAEFTAKKEDFQFIRRERPVGKVEHSFKLGRDLDAEKVEASFENGVLHVTIPLRKEAVGRKIQIK